MTDKKHSFSDGIIGAAVTVKVTPRASHDEITGVTDDGVITMRVTASRGDASANSAVIALLSKKFKVSNDRFEVVAGYSTSQKLISIEGLSVVEVEHLLGVR